MVSLNTRLNSIGITSAKGVELVMLREQVSTTLPQAGSGSAGQNEASSTRTGTNAVVAAKLSAAEQREVRQLEQLDRAVRAHEQAHLSAGRGVVTSGADFTYTYGPDGKQYATAGEVGIDTSPERQPEDNIDKGIRIQAAALAPRDPSPEDYQVAAVGSQLEGQGRSDLARRQLDERVAAVEAAREKNAAALDPTASRGRRVQEAYLATGVTHAARVNTFA